MTDPEQAAADLAFVRDAVERRKTSHHAPTPLAILWAVIVLAGCVINDFAAQYAWMYWSLMPTIGFALSKMIGVKDLLKTGDFDPKMGIRSAMHWGSLFLVGAPLWVMGFSGKIDGNTMGQLLFLVSGVYWFLAGVHLNRRFMWPGLAMIVSSCAMIFVHRYAWTMSGVLVCIALLIGFSQPEKSDER